MKSHKITRNYAKPQGSTRICKKDKIVGIANDKSKKKYDIFDLLRLRGRQYWHPKKTLFGFFLLSNDQERKEDLLNIVVCW